MQVNYYKGLRKYKEGKLEVLVGRTPKETLESLIKRRLNKALDDVGYTIRYFETIGYKESELYKTNPFVIEQLEVKNHRFYGMKFDIIIIDDNSFVYGEHFVSEYGRKETFIKQFAISFVEILITGDYSRD